MHPAPAYLAQLRLAKAQARLRPWLHRGLGLALALLILAGLTQDWVIAVAPLLLGTIYGGMAWIGYRQYLISTAVADLHRPGVRVEVLSTPLSARGIVDTVWALMLTDGIRWLGIPLALLSLAVVAQSGLAGLLVPVAMLAGLGITSGLLLAFQCWSLRSRVVVGTLLTLNFYLWFFGLSALVVLTSVAPWVGSPCLVGWVVAFVWGLHSVMVEGLENSARWEERFHRWSIQGRRRARLAWLSERNPVLGRGLGSSLRGRLAPWLHLGGMILSCLVGGMFSAFFRFEQQPGNLLHAGGKPPLLPGEMVAMLVLYASGILLVWAALSAYRMVRAEKESGSLDLLRGSRLSAAACVDAWACSGSAIGLLSAVLVFLCAAPALCTVPFDPWILAGSLPVPFLCGLTGAYSGIANGLLQKGEKVQLSVRNLLVAFLALYLLAAVLGILLAGPAMLLHPKATLVAPLVVGLLLTSTRRSALKAYRDAPR